MDRGGVKNNVNKVGKEIEKEEETKAEETLFEGEFWEAEPCFKEIRSGEEFENNGKGKDNR